MAPLELLPHSCSYCQNFIFDLEDQERGLPGSDMASKGLLFKCTLRDIKLGVLHECEFCVSFMNLEVIHRDSMLKHQPNNLPVQDLYWKLLDGMQELAMWIPQYLGSPTPEITLANLDDAQSSRLEDHRLFAAIHSSVGEPDIETIYFFGLCHPQTGELEYRTRQDFTVFTEPDDPAASVVQTRPIESHPASNLSVARIPSWLDECQTTHEMCRSTSGIMPARIIEVGNGHPAYQLRLRDTQHLGSIQFAALSYCWGNSQPLRCLDNNVLQFVENIPFSNLPATIRDAVITCHTLGLKYLWVDALCIIQDNPQDKSSEIAKMPYIYGNAVFTIAAARSHSVDDGFLHQRAGSPKGQAFKLPYRCEGNILGSITLVDIPEETDPIEERAWTFQERLLSKRTIEFGSRQTRWFCQEVGVSQEYTDGWRAQPEYSETRQDTINTLRFRNARAFSLIADYVDNVRYWNQSVQAYTRRKLTVCTDRALAISGIAEVFGELLSDQYKAGLWESAMPAALFWTIVENERLPRPTVYQGPSWSWTSVNGPVDFRFANLNTLRPQLCQAEILSIDCIPENDKAPFGAISQSSGELKLRARTATGVRAILNEERDKFAAGFKVSDEAGSRIAHAHMHPDAIEEYFLETGENNKDDAAVTMLEIQSRIYGASWQCRGLVLHQVPARKGYYRRLGTFEFHTGRDNRKVEETEEDFEKRVALDYDWFRHQPYSEVTLI